MTQDAAGSTEAPGSGRACEFFAGMGLVRLALERAGWRVAWANDIDPLKARLYRAAFPGDPDHFDDRDVHAVDARELPAADLWTASFPCTDLSLAGRGAGIFAGQSGAVWGMLALLEAKGIEERPRWLLFENVVGLLTSHAGADLRALIERVNELGYGVEPLRVDAARFTGQSRPRLLLACTRFDDAASPGEADLDALAPHPARPQRLIDAMRAHGDLQWQARELPPLPAATPTIAEVCEALAPDDDRWWPDDRARYFVEQLHPGHRARAEVMIAGDRMTRACAFRRVRAVGDKGAKKSVTELRTDGLAGCLRTPKGGSAKQILFEAGRGDYRVRFLTARECARLQGADLPERVSSGFRENEILFGLGDAVCVPAIAWALGLLRPETDYMPSSLSSELSLFGEHPDRSTISPRRDSTSV